MAQIEARNQLYLMGTSLDQKLFLLGLLLSFKNTVNCQKVSHLWEATKIAKEVIHHMFDSLREIKQVQ